MPVATRQLASLSEPNRKKLERFLLDFEQSWQPGLLLQLAARLPGECPGCQAAALEELVKIDMERSWKVGMQVTVEDYLSTLPALAAMETTLDALVQAEYDIRQRYGSPVELEEYRRRFPQQFPALEQWLAGRSDTADDDADARFLPEHASRCSQGSATLFRAADQVRQICHRA